MNYKDSGVDIEAGNAFVEKIKGMVPTIGGFNGMMKVPTGYEKPVLVSGTDGVGTKLNVAGVANIHNSHKGVGIDLVAMCVNDVITSGAKPLYFLDYIATGKLDSLVLEAVIEGILEGCNQSGMDLLGGETAEMPRMYDDGKYDLAGFCTGIVEEFDVVDGSLIKPGDKVIGLASSGLHSNGFSLINKLMFMWDRRDGIDSLFGIDEYKDFFDLHPIEEVLTPTTIYAPIVKKLLDEFPILGMAHITGGGLPENLPRCLPEGLTVDVDYSAWERPEIFKNIAKHGNVSEEEMRNVFNLGIGFCLVVPPDVVDDVMKFINIDTWVIGTCV
jgi:phosphoribosylformylglycinamidine cyclo-ligase